MPTNELRTPWALSFQGPASTPQWEIVDAAGVRICALPVHRQREADTVRAQARLLVESPQLLAALSDFIETFRREVESGTPISAADADEYITGLWRQAAPIVAKAKGE